MLQVLDGGGLHHQTSRDPRRGLPRAARRVRLGVAVRRGHEPRRRRIRRRRRVGRSDKLGKGAASERVAPRVSCRASLRADAAADDVVEQQRVPRAVRADGVAQQHPRIHQARDAERRPRDQELARARVAGLGERGDGVAPVLALSRRAVDQVRGLHPRLPRRHAALQQAALRRAPLQQVPHVESRPGARPGRRCHGPVEVDGCLRQHAAREAGRLHQPAQVAVRDLVLEQRHLDAAVPHRARHLAVPRVHAHEYAEVGVRPDHGDAAVDEAALVDHEHAVGLQQRVQAVQNRRVAQVRLVQKHPVAVLERLDQQPVHPLKAPRHLLPRYHPQRLDLAPHCLSFAPERSQTRRSVCHSRTGDACAARAERPRAREALQPVEQLQHRCRLPVRQAVGRRIRRDPLAAAGGCR